MNNLAPSLATTATLIRGLVIDTANDRFIVAAGAQRYCAARAPSCLLQPLVGDRVLLADGQVLAIVGRDIEAPTTLHATELRITAERLSLSADELNLVGRAVTAAGQGLRLVAATITQTAERVSSFAQRHLRHSSVHDEVNAEAATVRCGGIHETHADSIVSQGAKVVRIDGGQLQLG